MFKNLFSFEGRIRRTEYGISFIIYIVIAVIINLMIEETRGNAGFLAFAYIPLLWFLWAQGAKRCHDVGNTGWWQLIPFYGFWLLFQEGDVMSNKYGENPKGNNISQGYANNPGNNANGNNSNGSNSTGSYQGGYSGGHNNPNQSFNSNQQTSQDSNNNTSGYRNGDLYN